MLECIGARRNACKQQGKQDRAGLGLEECMTGPDRAGQNGISPTGCTLSCWQGTERSIAGQVWYKATVQHRAGQGAWQGRAGQGRTQLHVKSSTGCTLTCSTGCRQHAGQQHTLSLSWAVSCSSSACVFCRACSCSSAWQRMWLMWAWFS